MALHLIIKGILILAVLTVYKNGDNKKIIETRNNSVIQRGAVNSILVDYKSDTYKISLGENYKISGKIIHWHWAALADDDNKIDSTGKDAFIYLEEPLIQYNNSEYLPSLHIVTDRNLIMSFTCSVLFKLKKTSNSMEDFLQLMSKDIKKLQVETVKKSIINSGIFKTETEDYIETYKLIKGKGIEFDKFEYSIKKR